VPYPEDVSLIRTSGGKRIVARGVNISASGLYVHCVEPCEIGSQVVCTVLLDGGPRKVRGSITRLEALPGMIGAAIAFSELSERDLLALRGYVERHRVPAVEAKVQLLGMTSPVRCQAVYDGDTIRLSTALPFLRLDSAVGVHRDCDPAGATTSGVLSRIALDPTSADGIPRLALDVEVTQVGTQLGDQGGNQAVTAAANGADGDRAPTQSGLAAVRPDRRSPLPLPSVVVSQTLQTETLAMAASRLLGETAAQRRDTAEVPRPWHAKHWAHPPAVATSRRRGRRHGLRWRLRRFFGPLEALTGLPFWASCVFALLFGFVTALILR